VVDAHDLSSLRERLSSRQQNIGRPCFAERYVEGRELNVSLLAGPRGPNVLPPAEILFCGFPANTARLVDYRAKWDPDSLEYQNTPRRFRFPAADQPLLEELVRLTRSCWYLFGLRGYARVDFRVDPRGKPWILEVNANPCLSPDAGFAAALGEAGLSFQEGIERILADAVGRPARTSDVHLPPPSAARRSGGHRPATPVGMAAALGVKG
jgi:D-alanine-D-alanine ligase